MTERVLLKWVQLNNPLWYYSFLLTCLSTSLKTPLVFSCPETLLGLVSLRRNCSLSVHIVGDPNNDKLETPGPVVSPSSSGTLVTFLGLVSLRRSCITSDCFFLHGSWVSLCVPILAYWMAAARWKGRWNY